jgi:hypothetical protein
MMKTCIHELLHALNHEYGLRLRHRQIYALEGALTDFILRNFKPEN